VGAAAGTVGALTAAAPVAFEAAARASFDDIGADMGMQNRVPISAVETQLSKENENQNQKNQIATNPHLDAEASSTTMGHCMKSTK
jgi:hypothetical protein